MFQEPRFKLQIHAELHAQFQQMQPIAMLNSQAENPIDSLGSSLGAKDRLKFLPHSILGDEVTARLGADGVSDGSQSLNESGQNPGFKSFLDATLT